MPDPSREHIERFLEGQVGKLQKDKVEDSEKRVYKDGQNKNTRNGIEDNIKKKEVKYEGDTKSQGGGTKNGASDLKVFRPLLANYTPMEKDMLKKLCRLTTKEREVPREWKRFLNYHRLAWTIFSHQDLNMKSEEFKGWQRKLILWIFICWNWRDQMDAIFENWNVIKSECPKWQTKMREKDKNDDSSLELCDIIHTYLKRRRWSTKEDVNQNRGKQGGEIAPKAWIDLYETLKDEYDIPMHFIEKFQQFRLYCKLNHLEIDELYKRKKMTHLTSRNLTRK